VNLAQFIDPEYVERMKARGDVRPGSIARIAEPVTMPERARPGEQRAAVFAAQRGVSLSFRELHQAVGGNRASLGVLVSQLKKRGAILAEGENRRFRYRLPA
jgi:hypothetical protein